MLLLEVDLPRTLEILDDDPDPPWLLLDKTHPESERSRDQGRDPPLLLEARGASDERDLRGGRALRRGRGLTSESSGTGRRTREERGGRGLGMTSNEFLPADDDHLGGRDEGGEGSSRLDSTCDPSGLFFAYDPKNDTNIE